jgi:hypothetical protein
MQKRAIGGFDWPQAEQVAASADPQLIQNRAVAGFSALHDGQPMAHPW